MLGMSQSLRSFINLVRSAKTAADERQVIAKECALIRTSFKKEESQNRALNLIKLIYCHLLGYPTQFGQLECLKLIVSSLYSEKRTGYLALMILLDEKQEVLMLVTNSLKNDLDHTNPYVVGLALTALGNIASPQLSQDCASDVEHLMSSSNTYICKKAIFAAIRILRKVPGLMDQFLPKISDLIHQRSHVVLIATASLMIQMCTMEPRIRSEFQVHVMHIVKLLSSLLHYGPSVEYDTNSSNDAFLEIKLLQLLRLLGRGNNHASMLMTTFLTPIASIGDGPMNVPNMIFYECIKTVLAIDSGPGLCILAINTLSKLLNKQENNIRYIALNILCNIVNVDVKAIQRHRQLILDCIRDEDESISKRALDLTFALIDKANIKRLSNELLKFLKIATPECQNSISNKLSNALEKYSPHPFWHFDTMFEILTIQGRSLVERNVFLFLNYLSITPSLHAYSVKRFYYLLKDQFVCETYILVSTLWCIGEFGYELAKVTHFDGDQQLPQKEDTLLSNMDWMTTPHNSSGSSPTSDVLSALTDLTPEEVSRVTSVLSSTYPEEEVIALLLKIQDHASSLSLIVKQHLLTCALKYSVHVKNQTSLDSLKQLIGAYLGYIDLDLQQRSLEYLAVVHRPELWKSLLAPILLAGQNDKISKVSSTSGDALISTKLIPSQVNNGVVETVPQSIKKQQGLEDLLDFNSLLASSTLASVPVASNPTSNLLNSLFFTPSNPLPPLPQASPASLHLLTNTYPYNTYHDTPDHAINSNLQSLQPNSYLDSLSSMGSLSNLNESTKFTSPSLTPLPFYSQPLQDSPPAFSSAPCPTFDTPEGLHLKMEVSRIQPQDPHSILIFINYTNRLSISLTHLDVKIAIPKYLQMQSSPTTDAVLLPSEQNSVTQSIQVLNPTAGQSPVMLKLRIQYNFNQETKIHIFEVNQFPSV